MFLGTNVAEKSIAMSHDSRIDKLLEEILDSSRTAEEVCADCPELLSEVRSRLQRVQSVAVQVEMLFPCGSRPSDGQPWAADHDLPEIPGYEMQAVLGRGGMGVVYRARHIRLNRSVALKMLLAGSYASQVEWLRFVREAEAVAGLRHPHIVQVYDVGEVDGCPYYTMELVDGGSLAEKACGAPLAVREAAEMLVVLARAVQSAHDGGIVHRDIKPANILLTVEGVPKISDFGLARRVDIEQGLTVTGAKIGTPSYMAPEQISGGAIGPAVDVFALGALLYEMLTGRPPFRGDSLSETERRLTSEEPESPSRVNKKVPRDLETICLKCLQKAPQQRYGSAAELADDLERFLRYEPIQARPATPLERTARWIRRNPAWSAMIVMGIAIVGLLTYDAMEELASTAARNAEKKRLTARLESGIELERQGHYAEARALLGELGDGGHADLRQRIDRAVANLDLIEELDLIELDRVSIANGSSTPLSNKPALDQRYAAVFASTGVGSDKDSAAIVAHRISGSDIQPTLIAALDDWAACASDAKRRDWLLEVARRADPDPSGWRDRARDPATWNDRQVLQSLADSFSHNSSSIQLLCALCDRLDAAGAESIAFRKQVQKLHSDNYLANVSLANALRERDPAAAVRFYQAALAVEPKAVLARNNFGVALWQAGQLEEAIDQLQLALQSNPQLAVAHYNLELAYGQIGESRRAIDCFERTIALEPNHAAASIALGEEFLAAGDPVAAEASLVRAMQLLHPDDPRTKHAESLLRRSRNKSSASPKPEL